MAFDGERDQAARMLVGESCISQAAESRFMAKYFYSLDFFYNRLSGLIANSHHSIEGCKPGFYLCILAVENPCFEFFRRILSHLHQLSRSLAAENSRHLKRGKRTE
jgi:hypothetical protein